jgi:hypothetical protein
MDVAYNQHSPHSRHQSRSSTNLNHLTLAPLTSRLPISDSDDLPDTHHVSYIEGRSAPTTPSILSRSSSRVSLRKPAHITLPKSKSSTHLLVAGKQPRPTATTPVGTKLRNTVTRDELSLSTLSAKDRNDSDWLLRAGASISSSTRESKGQAWLVSRASSTSLTAQRDEDEEELERSLAREREQASRRGSRRGSGATFDADDEFSPVTRRRSLSFGPPTGSRSRPMSRFGSRSNSRRGSRAQLFTPIGGEREGYFDHRDFAQEEFVTEPDFVNAEEEGYDNEDEVKDDEAVVRKLARASNSGLGGWVERMLGWSLFAVDEDGEEGEDTEVETSDERAHGSDVSSKITRRNFDGPADQIALDMPPLKDDETGGWQDAAWLLSVATKVLL